MNNEPEKPMESTIEVKPISDITPSDIIESGGNDDTVSLCGVAKIGGENNSPKISKRQSNFIDNYIEGYSLSDSIRNAKYNNKNPSATANLLLKKPHIIKEIERRKEELRALAMMDKPSFIQLVMKHMKEAKQESTKARLLELYGSLLGYTQKDTPVQVNLMQYLDKADQFFKAKD